MLTENSFSTVKSRPYIFAIALLMLTLLSNVVWAGGANDEAVRQIIVGILDAEYKQKKYDAALENLQVADVVCEGDACSKQVRAELQIAIGTVQAARGNDSDAQKAFSAALKDDPNAKLYSKYKTADATAAFKKAKRRFEKDAKEGCRGSYRSGGPTPRGWRSGEAKHCATQARKAEKSKNYQRCHQDARSSLELEERVDTRVQLARCLELDNRWNDAAAEYQEVARKAPKSGKFRAARQAAGRARMLQRRMPVLILKPPADTNDLVVKLDGTTLPVELLGIEMPVDPGNHKVQAQTSGDLPLTFEEEVDLAPGKTVTLAIRMAPGAPKWATRAELKCLLGAKNQEAFSKCLERRSSGPSDFTFRVSTEVSGYTDSMDVHILSPSVSANVEHVTDGWGVGVAMLVDVVSAASVDILATASPRWSEVRYAPSLNAHKKFDTFDVSLAGSISIEPDYLSGSVGLNTSLELADKMVTPSLGYQYSHDVNARADTSWDVFSKHINRHAVSAGVGVVLSKATFGSASLTVVAEDGDLSKPYRHIPMFAPEVVPLVPAGLTVDGVNNNRLPIRPLEQLPLERQRYGLAFSIAHRFSDSTLRISERGYLDSWGVLATTTDIRFMYDLAKDWRFWPHVRAHYQGDASFYKMAYAAQQSDPNDPDSPYVIPQYRSGDRELGQLFGLTTGGIRHDFGERRAYGVMFNGDLVSTFFLNHLFTKQRFGFFGALTFEAEIE